MHHMMYYMDINMDNVDHDRISAEVRIRLAARLERMLDDLAPMVDPDSAANMGEVSASAVTAYLGIIKAMGSLYQVQQRPETDSVPVAKVARMLEEAKAIAAAEAVEEFRSRLAIESATSRDEAVDNLRKALRRD